MSRASIRSGANAARRFGAGGPFLFGRVRRGGRHVCAGGLALPYLRGRGERRRARLYGARSWRCRPGASGARRRGAKLGCCRTTRSIGRTCCASNYALRDQPKRRSSSAAAAADRQEFSPSRSAARNRRYGRSRESFAAGPIFGGHSISNVLLANAARSKSASNAKAWTTFRSFG